MTVTGRHFLRRSLTLPFPQTIRQDGQSLMRRHGRDSICYLRRNSIEQQFLTPRQDRKEIGETSLGPVRTASKRVGQR